MRFHATIDEEDMHPEDPRRIFEIYKTICQAGLIDDPLFVGNIQRDDIMKLIAAREVTREEALLVHTEEHWSFLEGTQDMDVDTLQDITRAGDSVYFNAESFFCSRLSCGGAIETCDAVLSGEVKNAIAVIRPPGHHAEPDKAMGFCLFNNVCVATKVMQAKYPEKCKRVLILDWFADISALGNGTQEAFYEDPSVLYISIHRYQGGNFYPSGPAGNLDQCGKGKGLGMNVNVPWATGGLGDAEYMYAFQRLIMPIATEFNPDLVIVSAGFDAAAGDTLGGCFVTPAGYAHMTHMLMCLAEGKIVVCLEGGYNLRSIADSALAVTKVLMGEPPGKLHDGVHASKGAIEVVHECVVQQSLYWRCMRPRDLIPIDLKAARLNEVVRIYQAQQLWDSYMMTTLPILKDKIVDSFTHQIIATSNYQFKETIVFIVHDPPPVIAKPDILTNRISLQSSCLLDAGQLIIDWAYKQGFGVIDANFPEKYHPKKEGIDSNLIAQSDELCLYMWDNYLEVTDAKNIILIGIGYAVSGLVGMLSLRDPRERVRAVISFLSEAEDLRAVSTNVLVDEIGEWYHSNSRCYISCEHVAWERTKHRRKFGHLVQSPATTIHDIIHKHLSDATQFALDQLS
ncbi:histone deacetylase Clr3 [Pyronema omphalodes]|nr:histone deacetylase Clr3 [Pyronema omphalodes]